MNPLLTQSDLVTAYGWGIDALWQGLLSGVTAIKPTDRFADRGFISDCAALIPDLQVSPNQSRVMAMLQKLLAPLVGKLDPQTPLILATTVGEIEFIEQAVLTSNPSLTAQANPEVLLARIKNILQLHGPAMIISSACASSTIAVTRAASMIRHHDAPAVLVVACDAISEFVYSGFSSLLGLSETPARPFDTEHDGLTLGEAAAYLLLTSPDSPHAPHSTSQILGYGSTTDAVHMTAPDRSAAGLSNAILKACSMAHRPPTDINFIAAHGTATVFSDAMEMTAFRKIFPAPIPTFSLKGAIGHTLAATGLLQILIADHALAHNLVPPTVGLTTPNPAALNYVSDQPAPIPPHALALSTNSGFGGVNTAILLTRRPQP